MVSNETVSNHILSRREISRRYYANNKTKVANWHKKWAANNRTAINSRQRKWRRDNDEHCYFMASRARMKVDITYDQYKQMLADQEGKCKICRRLPEEDRYSRGRLCMDHLHGSSIVRGLICSSCNVGIGHFDDNIDRLKAAITYLEDANAKNPC